MAKKYNIYGHVLSDDDYQAVRDDSYVGHDGRIQWSRYILHGDEDGFDLLRKTNGLYRTTIVLPVGKKVVRYGSNEGFFTTEPGTDFEMLSLPYVKASCQYHEYIVAGFCKVECVVDAGYVAPGFGCPGGAVQYKHYETMRTSIRNGILREDWEWLNKLRS